MKELLLMRHATAAWGDRRMDDHDRPLNERGRLEASSMGAKIASEEQSPDLICCSSALRTLTTAELVAEACGYSGKLRIEPRIYLAESGVYLDLLSALSERRERVLLVGHNPGISNLLFALTGQSESMVPAAVAPIELEAERWREVHWARPGRARGVWSPGQD